MAEYKKCNERYRYNTVPDSDAEITEAQKNRIARGIARKASSLLRAFYSDPVTERKFREWCYVNYGYYPETRQE